MYRMPRRDSRAMCHKMAVTKVTIFHEAMTGNALSSLPRRIFQVLDPRRSLGTKVGWLVTSLSVIFAIIAALWLGTMTRDGLLQQHCRQLALDAEQLLSTLDQAMGTRVQSLQTIAAIVGTEKTFRTQSALRTVLDLSLIHI